MPDYDCVIAGAGPTGLTLALELARRGKSVAIFDRSPGPRPEEQSRALGILPSTLTILEPSGVAKSLLTAGMELKRATFCHGQKEVTQLHLDRGGGRYPYIVALPQGKTERL